METIKEHLNIRNTAEVYNEIEKTLQRIDEYVAKNDYQKSNNIKIDKTKLMTALNDGSLRKRKVLRRYMYKINVHPTLDVVNKFLHFLFKTILNSEERVKITKSLKEQEIMKKRLEFKKALNAMLEAKAAYQLEKGDFYKQRISKNQAI